MTQIATVKSVNRSAAYTFTKPAQDSITLIAGIGVEGDIHAGKTVRHRSRVRKDPTVPNLRQVHLIHSELHEELVGKGFDINPGEMGENITTTGVDLLNLPKDTILHLGDDAKIQVTGLRNPCNQLNTFQQGLLNEVIDKNEAGHIIRKSGIMSIVLQGGVVKPGDRIRVELPPGEHVALEKV